MIKNFSRILLVFCCLFVIMSCSSEAVKTTAFKVGDNYYKSLQDACDAIVRGDTGSVHTVEIVKDASGSGVDIKLESESKLVPNYILIDLGENKYTVNDTTTATDADFKISGGMLAVSGDGGEIVGSGKTFFSLNDSQIVLGPGLTIISKDILVEANTSDVFIDAYFDESIGGNIKLNNGKLYINSKEGSIEINNLYITGEESQVVFNEPRTTNDMEIGKITIDSHTAPDIPFTTSYVFTTTEYDEIDEILKTRKIHRHKLGTGKLVSEATCSSDEYYSYKCNECDVSVVRAKENSTNPDKHNLTHIAAVEATPTTSGIKECMRCEYCGKYFDINDNTKVVDPILLATDNVLYSDLEKAGLNDLSTTICSLEKKLDGIRGTKGTLDNFSNILGILGFVFDMGEMLFTSNTDDVQKCLDGLNKIEGDINSIKQEVANINDAITKVSEATFVNPRLMELNGFYGPETAVYYKNIVELLCKKEAGYENLVIKYINKWVSEDNLKKAMSLLLNGTLKNQYSQRNYFEAYDYLAKTSCAFESLAKDYRTALFSLEENTVLMAYHMSYLYYKYCYEPVREKDRTDIIKTLNDALLEYWTLGKNCQPKKDYAGAVTCWLDGYNGRALSTATRVVEYAKEIRDHQSEYGFDIWDKETSEKSVNKLIEYSNGECIPSDFYEKVYKWYNGNRSAEKKKNIYQILEYIGFEPPVGEKWTDKNYGNSADDAIFLVSDRGDDFHREEKYKEGKCRMIIFYQGESKNKDWIGIRSAYGLGDTSFLVKKMYTGANYTDLVFTPGKITKLGTPTKYQFFTLDYYTQPAK